MRRPGCRCLRWIRWNEPGTGPSSPFGVANGRRKDARPRSDCGPVRFHGSGAAGPGRPGVGAATLRGLEDGGSELMRILKEATGGALEGGISGLKPLLPKTNVRRDRLRRNGCWRGSEAVHEWRIVSQNSFRPDRYPRKQRRRARCLFTHPPAPKGMPPGRRSLPPVK